MFSFGFLFFVYSNLFAKDNDSLNIWNNPMDTMEFCIVFRGDFKAFENYRVRLLNDSDISQLICINGTGAYSYHYFSGFEQFLKTENLESRLKIFQKRLFYQTEIAIRIPHKDSGKNILYFEKVRSPETNAQFNVKWIDRNDLHHIMWLDYCYTRHFYNRKRIRVKCIVL